MSKENKNTQYRMLDESGLWEDEEGNLYSSSELEDYEPMDPAIQKNISERLKKGKKALHLQNTISQFYTNNFI